MNFEQELKNMLSKIQGALGAILMGFDGIIVAKALDDTLSEKAQEAAVEFSRVLRETIKIGQGNDLGLLSELVVSTETFQFVFRVVNAEYFLVLFLQDRAYTGKGRYVLRRSTPDIHRAL